MTGMETLVSAAVAAQVARKITDYAEEEIKLCCSFHGDLEHMKKTLSNMQPQLKRAEDNSFGSDRENVREWLRLMKSVAYDIEDILDEYYYRNPSEQFDEICCIACARKVPLLCSMSISNPALTRICMVHKMKTERQRLQKELVAPNAYGFHEIIKSPGNNFEEKETTSQANGTAIIGRDKDVENIMAMVRVKKYLIITILGAVGLGKTSLAQLVYNHDETSKIFKTQKMWIHVPKGKASLKYIGTYMISRDGGKIHENMTEEDIMNGVGAMLNNYDSYLIVLDGLWSASEKALQNLKEMLATGSEKNVKVIVTTHSEKVAALMSTRNLPAYKLDTLPETSIMTIFSQRAMASADEMEIITQHPLFSDMFEKYGKKIIERCEGTPLVANFLGSVINSGRMSRQWGDYWAPASIEEMWKVEEDFDNNRCNISLFLPSLKPIYYNMHNELRLCFVYISIFPEGSAIDKKKLIQQWVALNMIEPSRHGNLRPEETAEDYIEQLKEMYFLQITAQHSPVNEKVLHVHNLAYELARSVGSKDILVISDATTKKEAKQSSCNHDYRYSHDYRYAQLSTPVLLSVDPKNSINKARSLILKTLESERFFVSQVISENKYLRVLDLSGCSICELPDCIFKLKHLRYLDASGLPITILPPELGNLVKLETLDVSGTNLTLVPSCISSLKVLKYLNLKGCQNLQQLHSLDELRELCYLNLSGCLCVGNLPKSLQELKNLCFLNLADVHILPEGLLQSVESLKSLEDLILSGLELQTLPDIFGQLSSLRFLNLSRCSTLQQLPQSLFDLRSLKGLDLSFCSGIEEITESFGRLYSLTSLNLSGCSSLRILPTSFGDLIHLEELNLSYCTALAKLPISFRRLEHLHVLKLSRCGHLIEQVNHLANSLEHLELASCQDINLQSNLFSYLTRLRILDLSNCSQMEIVIGTHTQANLEVLVLANVALPLDLNFLTQLQNLQKLDITDATLSTAALSNLKHILGCMPMLKSVETNNLDVYSILPSRIKISRVMDSLTGVESSNIRDRENTDGRQTTSVIEAGPNTSAEGPDLVGHSSSSSEEITEHTYVENANRDLTSSTNSDATKVDALEDYANSNVNGETKLQDCEHQARPINYCSSSSISSGSIPSASSSGTSTLDSNFKTEELGKMTFIGHFRILLLSRFFFPLVLVISTVKRLEIY